MATQILSSTIQGLRSGRDLSTLDIFGRVILYSWPFSSGNLGNDDETKLNATHGQNEQTDGKKGGSEEKQVGVCKITFTPKEVPTTITSSLEKFNYELGLACSRLADIHDGMQ